MNKWVMSAGLLSFLSFVGVRRFRSGRRMRPIQPVRFILRAALLATVAVLLMLLRSVPLTVFLGGLTIGLMLSLYSLALTSFEPGVKRPMFKPHPQIGNFLFALFLLRVGWRMSHRLFGDEPAGHPFGPDAPSGPPWTMLLMFVLLGYAMSYTIGLVVRARSIPRLADPADAISDGSVAG